ncbi:flagellar hook-basal body complex protein FliE [Methylomagnum ishizawai]|uniref:Flagellar hook-basal body complex protein FliE n=1 Tax=Methylomagnum ishizawai TaxID=1760988 RepID=A0A1Y6D4M6_9GAMM|nr:flagellar hook-basal body complex protein FliE [Methylomagnum ishizawai]SMF95492.1 flagellar hook-basal body complex protein FliE [Methylomagnum ishizawai]
MNTNTTEINTVLNQIHRLRDQMQQGTSIRSETPSVNFGQLLKQSVDKVNDTQHYADKLAQDFESGEPGLNLAEVMIAAQKAGVSFQATVQVRNKLVDAYKEIMNMPM